MDFTIIWMLFFAGSVFLVFFLGSRIMMVRKMQKQQIADYHEKCEKYRVFTSEMFDELPIDELTHGVLFHIMAKKDKLFENETTQDVDVFDVLSHGERLIYTIYQTEISMEGGRGSLYSFFIKDEFALYRPLVDESFRAVNCFEIADLMKAAAKLAQIVEEDLDDEVEDVIEGDYATYNFSDYTNEILSLLKSSGIIEKSGKYVKDHKEEFIDDEVTFDEERISE